MYCFSYITHTPCHRADSEREFTIGHDYRQRPRQWWWLTKTTDASNYSILPLASHFEYDSTNKGYMRDDISFMLNARNNSTSFSCFLVSFALNSHFPGEWNLSVCVYTHDRDICSEGKVKLQCLNKNRNRLADENKNENVPRPRKHSSTGVEMSVAMKCAVCNKFHCVPTILHSFLKCVCLVCVLIMKVMSRFYACLVQTGLFRFFFVFFFKMRVNES